MREAIATGGVVSVDGAGGSNVSVWLSIYLVGLLPAAGLIASIAFSRRTSHKMPPRMVARVTFSASLVWPLLAIAGVQVASLLVLKTALGLVRGGRGHEAIATPPDGPGVPVLQPLAVAAA